MAGQLTISTLSDGTNSTSSTNCIQGSAKAWVNFVGSNGSVTKSYNVGSITRTGTGLYTVNFTNSLADANYAIFSSSTQQGVSGTSYSGTVLPGSQGGTITKTTSACNVAYNQVLNNGSGYTNTTDPAQVWVVIFD